MSFPRWTPNELNFLQENQKLLDESQGLHNFSPQVNEPRFHSSIESKETSTSFSKEQSYPINITRGDAVVPKFKRFKQDSIESFHSAILPSTSPDIFSNYFPPSTMPVNSNPNAPAFLNQYSRMAFNSPNNFPLYAPLPIIRPIHSQPLPSPKISSLSPSPPFHSSLPSHPLQLQIFPQPPTTENPLPSSSSLNPSLFKDRLIKKHNFSNENAIVDDDENPLNDFAVVSNQTDKRNKKEKKGENANNSNVSNSLEKDDFIVPQLLKKKKGKNIAKPNTENTQPVQSNQVQSNQVQSDTIPNSNETEKNNKTNKDNESNEIETTVVRPSEEIKTNQAKSRKMDKKISANVPQKKMKEEKQKARLLRNRVSAQLAREKKKAHVLSLEEKCNELEGKNQWLEEKFEQLLQENKELREFMKGKMKSSSKNSTFFEKNEENNVYMMNNFANDHHLHHYLNGDDDNRKENEYTQDFIS